MASRFGKLFVAGLLLFSTSALADSLTLGFGDVREYGKLTDYQVLTVDWYPTTHFGFVGGDLVGGKPDRYRNNARYNVAWYGVALTEDLGNLYDSIGYVKLSRQTYHLTSPYQFYLTFGLRLGSWGVSYRHLSNGGTGGANFGEDMVVATYTF